MEYITSLISNTQRLLITEKKAIEKGWITDEPDYIQMQNNSNIIDYNEYGFELKIDGKDYYIKRNN